MRTLNERNTLQKVIPQFGDQPKIACISPGCVEMTHEQKWASERSILPRKKCGGTDVARMFDDA